MGQACACMNDTDQVVINVEDVNKCVLSHYEENALVIIKQALKNAKNFPSEIDRLDPEPFEVPEIDTHTLTKKNAPAEINRSAALSALSKDFSDTVKDKVWNEIKDSIEESEAIASLPGPAKKKALDVARTKSDEAAQAVIDKIIAKIVAKIEEEFGGKEKTKGEGDDDKSADDDSDGETDGESGGDTDADDVEQDKADDGGKKKDKSDDGSNDDSSQSGEANIRGRQYSGDADSDSSQSGSESDKK